MTVHFNDNIYLFEFKVVELASERAAMAQLQAKGYADKYRGLDQPIHLIGVEFSKDTRNITAFEVGRCVRGEKCEQPSAFSPPPRFHILILFQAQKFLT